MKPFCSRTTKKTKAVMSTRGTRALTPRIVDAVPSLSLPTSEMPIGYAEANIFWSLANKTCFFSSLLWTSTCKKKLQICQPRQPCHYYQYWHFRILADLGFGSCQHRPSMPKMSLTNTGASTGQAACISHALLVKLRHIHSQTIMNFIPGSRTPWTTKNLQLDREPTTFLPDVFGC